MEIKNLNMSKTKIYEEAPENFNFAFNAVGCIVEHDGKFVLLHRQDSKPDGNSLGLPSGKIDSGETPEQAVIREVKEETGLDIPEEKILLFKKFYVKYPEYDFIYYLFHTKLNEKQDIRINHLEHKNFKWVTPEESLQFKLVRGLDYCIKSFFKSE